jgi:tRNA pseudouridine38-40 synthase
MSRVVLVVEYDGTNYHGWQAQKNSNLATIQQLIEIAISRVADHPVTTVCAGRTDAKVHAKGQILHFDTSTQRKIDSWVFGINSYLPRDIRVLLAQYVPLEFDARKSALYRTYDYIIYNSKISPSLFRNYLSWQYKDLNLEAMKQAANFWIGEHDFSSFRGKDCQSKTTVRKVYKITCQRKEQLIIISITANAFLKHMVRNMVGLLIKIGQVTNAGTNNYDRQYQPELAKKVLLAKNRTAASITAPPEGLYLVNVEYPEKFNIIQNKLNLDCLGFC